jgi:hypothetical protein
MTGRGRTSENPDSSKHGPATFYLPQSGFCGFGPVQDDEDNTASLINVEEYEFNIGGAYNNRIDRPDVPLPESIIQNLNESPERILKPILDMLWQAAGYWEMPAL